MSQNVVNASRKYCCVWLSSLPARARHRSLLWKSDMRCGSVAARGDSASSHRGVNPTADDGTDGAGALSILPLPEDMRCPNTQTSLYRRTAPRSAGGVVCGAKPRRIWSHALRRCRLTRPGAGQTAGMATGGHDGTGLEQIEYGVVFKAARGVGIVICRRTGGHAVNNDVKDVGTP